MTSRDPIDQSRLARLDAFQELYRAIGRRDQNLGRYVIQYRNLNEAKITELTTDVAALETTLQMERENREDHPPEEPITLTLEDLTALTQEASDDESTATADIPGTHPDALAHRETFLKELREFRPHILKLDHITPEYAMTYLLNKKTRESRMGCWETDKTKGYRTGKAMAVAAGRVAADDDGGYRTAGLLEFTNRYKQAAIADPAGAQTRPGHVYYHHLAVIARGGLREVKAALKGSKGSDAKQVYEASHLCHNDSCFNPSHVIVEPRLENRQRQGCKHLRILVRGAFTFHPCPHHRGSMQKRCLLPTQHYLESQTGFFEPDAPEISGQLW